MADNSQWIQLKKTQKLWHMWSKSFISLRMPIIDYQLATKLQDTPRSIEPNGDNHVFVFFVNPTIFSESYSG